MSHVFALKFWIWFWFSISSYFAIWFAFQTWDKYLLNSAMQNYNWIFLYGRWKRKVFILRRKRRWSCRNAPFPTINIFFIEMRLNRWTVIPFKIHPRETLDFSNFTFLSFIKIVKHQVRYIRSLNSAFNLGVVRTIFCVALQMDFYCEYLQTISS